MQFQEVHIGNVKAAQGAINNEKAVAWEDIGEERRHLRATH
jgi:hypothetical protein